MPPPAVMHPPPKASSKKRKSDDRLDLLAKCKKCDKNVPTCQTSLCSSSRQHAACVDCIRIAAEEIIFDEATNFNLVNKGINCFQRCNGVHLYDDIKSHLLPEIAAALNSVMTTFTCAVCFLEHPMKDGITCHKIQREDAENEELHTFCFECIKGFAATDQAALAFGGIGLACMQTGCQRALMLTEIRNRISAVVIKRLEDRVLEENLGQAEIKGLQRCKKCNYAVEVLGGRYFVCVCGNKQCIKCEDTFDNQHNDATCERKSKRENLTLDQRINDVIIRYCHKCKVQFVKSTGCNFMKCRCGASQCYICREQNITYEHFCKCPGLQSECICTKRCRQFADAKHIDAHRIELLKNKIKSGQKNFDDKEILQAMPQAVEERDDGESDEDDEDDEFYESDEDDGGGMEDDDDEEGIEINITANDVINLSSDDDDVDYVPVQRAGVTGPMHSQPILLAYNSDDDDDDILGNSMEDSSEEENVYPANRISDDSDAGVSDDEEPYILRHIHAGSSDGGSEMGDDSVVADSVVEESDTDSNVIDLSDEDDDNEGMDDDEVIFPDNYFIDLSSDGE